MTSCEVCLVTAGRLFIRVLDAVVYWEIDSVVNIMELWRIEFVFQLLNNLELPWKPSYVLQFSDAEQVLLNADYSRTIQ